MYSNGKKKKKETVQYLYVRKKMRRHVRTAGMLREKFVPF